MDKTMGRQEHLKEEELAFYVDALRLHRTDALPSGLLKHVEACMECQRAIIEISSLVPDEVYTQGDPHPFFGKDIEQGHSNAGLNLVLRIAAGIILVLAASAIVYFALFRRSTMDSEEKTANAQSADTAGRTSQRPNNENHMIIAQAGRFIPLPALEQQAGQEFRSSSSLNAQLTRPNNGDTISSNQNFAWEVAKNEKPYDFVIVANDGRDAVRTSVQTSSYHLNQQLPDGLYYWKLEQAGELVLVRKFFVVNRSLSITSP